jgi:hypothetical protein
MRNENNTNIAAAAVPKGETVNPCTNGTPAGRADLRPAGRQPASSLASAAWVVLTARRTG